LVELLRSRANSLQTQGPDPELAQRVHKLATQAVEVDRQLAITSRRMTSEDDEQIYGATRQESLRLSAERDEITNQLEVAQRAARAHTHVDVDAEVEAAMSILDEVERVTKDATARAVASFETRSTSSKMLIAASTSASTSTWV